MASSACSRTLPGSAAAASARRPSAAPPNRDGSKRAWNSATRSATSRGWEPSVVLDVGLAEGEPDLAQVLAVGADDGDLAGAQAGPQDEAVEAVALDRRRRRARAKASCRSVRRGVVELDARRDPHADVVEEDPLVVGAERVRTARRAPAARGGRAAAAARTATPAAPGGRRGSATPRRARRCRGRATSSARRSPSSSEAMRRTSPIARSGGTAARYAAGACAPMRSNSSRPRSSPTSATSAARSRSSHDVDSSSIARSSVVRIGRPLAVGAAHADGDAGQRAGADERLERPLIGAVGLGDDVGDALGQLGREAAARQVDEHRDPRPDRLGHLEHADQLALLQADDVVDELGQRRRRPARGRGRGAGSRARCGWPARCGSASGPRRQVERVGDAPAPMPGMSRTLTR